MVSFPDTHFDISGYKSPSRLDRNKFGGGLLLYVKEDVSSKILKALNENEAIYIEINVRNKTWLLGCSYNPQKSLIENHLSKLGRSMSAFLSPYERFILMFDFNSKPHETFRSDFMKSYNFKNIVKLPT